MHLLAITLAGFKTFARQTEIRFETGVTAIVGPNGAGKTNIVDGFKWVLGESQARDLRGRRMDEIIYAGGSRRTRAATAEVTVVIDNRDGRLPVDYQEVAIRRRLDRGGQSDYFLNGSRIRRRDLLDLLASTGLTTDSYAIVDQRDIEAIINCTPDQRRALIEEAAQVRAVKARRSEAAARLDDLAANLLRLDDLKGELEPRLAVLREQAQAAREAAEAGQRLELLRGSLVWEEWREARDVERRARTQLQGLERRLAEAKAQAETAETDFRRWRLELQAAQDRRLERERRVAELSLAASNAEHQLQLAEQRAAGQLALAEAAASEAGELAARTEAARALRGQLQAELDAARSRLEAVAEPPPPPAQLRAVEADAARRAAEQLRRELAAAQSELASASTRCHFQEEQLKGLETEVGQAQAELPQAEREHLGLAEHAAQAAQASAELVRARAELEALGALGSAGSGQRPLLREVLRAEPGYELALAAVLGPLADACVAPEASQAAGLASASASQVTVVFPASAPAPAEGSLWEHVSCRPGYEALGRRLLGQVVVGRDVDLDGTYREPGLIRAGADPRAALEARLSQLRELIAQLEPQARAAARAAGQARAAESRLDSLRSAAEAESQLRTESERLALFRAAEAGLVDRLALLEGRCQEAEASATQVSAAVTRHERALAEHAAEARRLELEKQRWRDRVGDLGRQLAAVDQDLAALAEQVAARERRAQAAAAATAAAQAELPRLGEEVAAARARMTAVQSESPEEDAELAAGARKLIALEEARVDARLRVGTLGGSRELIAREAELAQARLDQIRGRLPAGLAPEEVPGGRAREREMRALERRLEELGPTNPLAPAEHAELEERYTTLVRQLEDVAAARRDLESLIERLREEEDSRYEAVFGAVAANFQENFAELSAGGRATLRHAPGEDGPRSGVEILVQPPRKRLQNVTLLSSGERSLTALALVMALEAVNPAPFTILDEVDAALDDANVARFGEMLSRLGRERQLLVITHNHLTMASAGALYGIHLDESGSSHLVSVRLEEIRPARPAGGVSALA